MQHAQQSRRHNRPTNRHEHQLPRRKDWARQRPLPHTPLQNDITMPTKSTGQPPNQHDPQRPTNMDTRTTTSIPETCPHLTGWLTCAHNTGCPHWANLFLFFFLLPAIFTPFHRLPQLTGCVDPHNRHHRYYRQSPAVRIAYHILCGRIQLHSH